MAAETAFNVPETSFHCCSKCKGLFGTSADHMKHQVICNGNPFKCTSMYFACERKIFLQLFQSEDFQAIDGGFSLANFSKDDSFLDHVVKIRMPQDIFDPSIFLRSNTSSLQPTLQDTEILIDPNNLEPEVNKSDQYLQGSKSRYAESIEQDQLRTIINKNIDYLKSDDIPSLTSPTSKELQFTHSHSEPRLLSPIEKDFLPDVSKSRVQSPFEKCVNYLQEIGSAYPTTSLAYASNQSIPFSCNLSTDLLGGLASTQEETMTSVDDLPTLQYLDLAKKDIFFGQNPGLSQMNTKDPFLINATVKPDRPISAGPRYPTQPSKSCEDLQASPTFPLQDGNYFNFPSTLDEPTQLDYLDLATLDFLTNPSSFSSYGYGMHRDRSSDDRDDIYSECNFLFHEKSNHSPVDGDKLEKKSFEDNVKLTKSKIKRIRLKKVKRGIQKKTKGSSVAKINKDVKEKSATDKGRTFEALTDSISNRSSQDKKRFKRTYSAEYEPRITPSLTRKRKLMSSHDTLNFRISPDAKRKVKAFDRKFNETQRLCPTNAILNVKDSLLGYTEEEKDSMTAVFAQSGCIIVKKQMSGMKTRPATDHMITKVQTGLGESQMFVLEGKTLQTYESHAVTDTARVPAVSPIPANSTSASDNVKSVLVLKCQQCTFTTTSVTEFKYHNSNHEQESTSSVMANIEYDTDCINTSVENDTNGTVVNNAIDGRTVTCSNTTNALGYSFARDQEDKNQNSETMLDESVLKLCEQKMTETVTDTMPDTTGYNKLAVLSEAEVPNTGVSVYDDIENELQPSIYDPVNVLTHSKATVETSTVAPSTNIPVELSSCSNTSNNIFSATETIVGLNFEDDCSFSNPSYTQTETRNNVSFTVTTDSASCLSSMDNVCTVLQQPSVDSPPEQGNTTVRIGIDTHESFDEAHLACNILQQEVLHKMISETEDASQDSWTNLVSEPFTNVVIPDTLSEDKDIQSNASDKESPFGQKDMALECLEPVASEQRQSSNVFEAMTEVFISDQENMNVVDRQTEDTQKREPVVEQINIETVTNDTDHAYDISDHQVGADIDQELNADSDSSVSKNDVTDLEVDMTVSCNLVTSASCQEHMVSETSNVLASNSDIRFQGLLEHNKLPEEPFQLSSELTSTVKEYENTLRVESLDKAVQCSESEDDDSDTDTDESGTCMIEVSRVIVEQSEDIIGESKTQQASPTLVKLACESDDRGKVSLQNDLSKGTKIRDETITENQYDKEAKSDQNLQNPSMRGSPACSTVEIDHCYCTASRITGHVSVSPSYTIVTEQPTTSGQSSSTSTDDGLQTNEQSFLKAKIQKNEGALLSCTVLGCSFKTAQKKNLNAHLVRHNSEHNKLLCDQCAFTTSDRSSLRKHIQVLHEQYYRFKCPDCDYLSMLRENVAKHYRNKHLEEKLYACNQCEYRTGYTHLLKLHLMAHAGIRPYKCTACEYQVNNVNKVTRHIKTRHNGQFGITYEKLDLDFEVDAKQFQCQVKTCDKDINVIEVSEEQVREIIQAAKKKKLEKEKLKLKIPVFNPKKMKQKMVSILPGTIKTPDKTAVGEHTGVGNVHKIPDQQVTVIDKITLGSVNSRGSENPDIPLKTTKTYSGVENKVLSAKDVSTCHTASILFRNQSENTNNQLSNQSDHTNNEFRNQSDHTNNEFSNQSLHTNNEFRNQSDHTNNELRTQSDHTNNELESEYQCSMCDFRLKSHTDIAQHLLVCKMERNKMT